MLRELGELKSLFAETAIAIFATEVKALLANVRWNVRDFHYSSHLLRGALRSLKLARGRRKTQFDPVAETRSHHELAVVLSPAIRLLLAGICLHWINHICTRAGWQRGCFLDMMPNSYAKNETRRRSFSRAVAFHLLSPLDFSRTVNADYGTGSRSRLSVTFLQRHLLFSERTVLHTKSTEAYYVVFR